MDIKRFNLWALAWVIATALGCIVLARMELDRIRDAFETDARIVHRLLSQRASQQDAVMAMLTLLHSTNRAAQPGPRITSVYPQILKVQQREGDAVWPDAALSTAQTQSRQAGRAVLASIDFANGRFEILQAGVPASYAVQIDLSSMVPWDEWPMKPDHSPVRVTLAYQGQEFVLQPGRIVNQPWKFDFHKRLAADSQPFDVVAVRTAGWGDLPWLWMLGWTVLSAAALFALINALRQHAERRRAEELLRLGQVARLNTLGELAAGMAHELNQPLTAILANTQAASRLLNDEPPELATARDAMTHAVEQARRASDVVGRMRRIVERPEVSGQLQPVELQHAVRNALYLLEPECRRRNVTPVIASDDAKIRVRAEPVALEQIIHNLLTNALQALDKVPATERTLHIDLQMVAGFGTLTIRDSGPGIAADVLPRIFEPFFTTRSDNTGLGLGLSLCESLAGDMNGSLTAANHASRGAVFTLKLPLAESA